MLTYSIKRASETRKFHVTVMQQRLRNVQKSVMHMKSCSFANLHVNLLLFCCCKKSLLLWSRNLATMAGVSIKIAVASDLDRVTDCINKGPLVPFSRGRGGGGWWEGSSKCILPQKILKFQGPRNAIFNVLGTKFEDKRACFIIRENVAFNNRLISYLSVTQSIPTSNGQMMKTK